MCRAKLYSDAILFVEGRGTDRAKCIRCFTNSGLNGVTIDIRPLRMAVALTREAFAQLLSVQHHIGVENNLRP